MALYFCILVLKKSITPGVEWVWNTGHAFRKSLTLLFLMVPAPPGQHEDIAARTATPHPQVCSSLCLMMPPGCSTIISPHGTVASISLPVAGDRKSSIFPHCPLASHGGPRQSVIKLQSYNGEEPHSTASFKCSRHLSLVNGQQKRQQCKLSSLLKKKHVGGDTGETL